MSADKASSEVRKAFKDWFDRAAAWALADQIAQAKPGFTAAECVEVIGDELDRVVS